MNTLQITFVGALFALALASAAAAQPVWRCAGNSYSSQPCSNGRQVDTAAAPNAEEQRQAREVAERDRRLARTMVQDRREREHELRLAMGSGLTGFAHSAPSDGASLKPAAQRPPNSLKKPSAKPHESTTRFAKAPKNQQQGRAAPARAAAP